MKSAQVSINILNYNTYSKTKVCIESCLKQVGVSYTVLLIDNNSTDGSFEKLKEEYGGQIEYLRNNDNYGFAKGNNLGVEYCLKRGIKYSLLLNSDTELVGESLLSSLYDTMKSNQKVAIVSPSIYTVTNVGLQIQATDSIYLRLLRFVGVLPKNRVFSVTNRMRSFAHGSALFVDNQCFSQMGGFPEHYFMYGEEFTLSKKMLWSGYLIIENSSKNCYILHHHDKTGKIEPWRLYLMGRNTSIEYCENHAGKSRWWFWVFYILYIKSGIKAIMRGSSSYYYGMHKGLLLYKKGSSYQEIFEDAKLARECFRR